MSDQVLHVLDLPQLYTRPRADEILNALELLAVRPRDFTAVKDGLISQNAPVQVNPAGVTQYLTSIISSALSWLDSDELREAVWDAASTRLCERSGRTGMADITRTFNVPVTEETTFELTLREPALTADNLGNKTWLSSYLLSQRLRSLLIPPKGLVPEKRKNHERIRALELGAGTGLVGLSFAALWGQAASIHLTDLDDIVPNLMHNVGLNDHLLESVDASVTTGVFDWSVGADVPVPEVEKYDMILAADSLYSSDHPRWLVQTIQRLLRSDADARVVVELPLRTVYLPQVEDFKARMLGIGLEILEQGEEVGFDDWEGRDGEPLEVKCWWSVWCWKRS
ncbi:hypothetical protein KEM55_004403 [Ascosphaera atra]|nr:hypothetical protein KEM55_004403 [Ascosphaera atra]